MSFIADYWNNTERKDWPMKPRNYARASEIGSPFLDRYLAMKGIEPSNPWSERTLRIFDAGRMIEFLVTRTLRVAGILKNAQEWVELLPTDTTVGVKGYLDVIIGGSVDWDSAQRAIVDHLGQYGLKLRDEVIESKAMQIIKGLSIQYPDGFDTDMVVEIKSTGSLNYATKDRIDQQGNFTGYDTHKLQLYAYLEMTGLEVGYLFYIFKDDFRLAEVPVLRSDVDLREKFYMDLYQMASLLKNDQPPAKEPLVVYDPNHTKFTLNWEVSRSRYLSYIYGYASSDEYEQAVEPLVSDLNYALTSLRMGVTSWIDAYQELIDQYKLKQYV